MKFRCPEDLEMDEVFTSPKNRADHYQKHVVQRKEFDHISEDEYEKRADELAATPLNYKNILGYVSRENDDQGKQTGRISYVKYNKDTEEYVVYRYGTSGTIYIVSFYHRPFRQFEGEKFGGKFPYWDEIPQGK